MSGNIKAELEGHWVHAHEEDTGDQLVFRPATHPLPPSRGRRSFELRPDGTMIDHRIGPDDRGQPTPGSWNITPDGVLELHPAGAGALSMRVAQVGPDKLVLEK
jgi:hypothetical protein